jgi:hypothetical protein
MALEASSPAAKAVARLANLIGISLCIQKTAVRPG